MVASVISDELIGWIMAWVSELLEQNVFWEWKICLKRDGMLRKFSVLIIHDMKFWRRRKNILNSQKIMAKIVPPLTIPSYRFPRIIKKHFISPHNFHFNAKANFYEVVNYSILTMKKFTEWQWPHRITKNCKPFIGLYKFRIFFLRNCLI